MRGVRERLERDDVPPERDARDDEPLDRDEPDDRDDAADRDEPLARDDRDAPDERVVPDDRDEPDEREAAARDRDAAAGLRRSAAGTSSVTTAFVSCGISFSRKFAMRSSCRRYSRASFAVSASLSDSASVSIAV